jgi:3-hydroxyacyl-[acyl-carrier-protein] dehydratase
MTDTTIENAEIVIDCNRVAKMLPHRYPFLLVDRIVQFLPDQSATGLKNVTWNEPHFTGHFPGKPIMPGVLIIEAMAQTAALFVIETLGAEAEGKLVYFMSIEEAKFRRPVVPGDTMLIHVFKERQRSQVWKFRGECTVQGKKVAEALFSAMIADEKAEG